MEYIFVCQKLYHVSIWYCVKNGVVIVFNSFKGLLSDKLLSTSLLSKLLILQVVILNQVYCIELLMANFNITCIYIHNDFMNHSEHTDFTIPQHLENLRLVLKPMPAYISCLCYLTNLL